MKTRVYKLSGLQEVLARKICKQYGGVSVRKIKNQNIFIIQSQDDLRLKIVIDALANENIKGESNEM